MAALGGLGRRLIGFGRIRVGAARRRLAAADEECGEQADGGGALQWLHLPSRRGIIARSKVRPPVGNLDAAPRIQGAHSTSKPGTGSIRLMATE